MKIFIIGAVRGASDEWRHKLEAYVEALEAQGVSVYLPHRDTNQTMPGLAICRANMAAIAAAEEIHLFYKADSQGSHFDMGVAFALNKKLVAVDLPEYGEGKSFPRMVREWEAAGRSE